MKREDAAKGLGSIRRKDAFLEGVCMDSRVRLSAPGKVSKEAVGEGKRGRKRNRCVMKK